jgi:hypothetical protein
MCFTSCRDVSLGSPGLRIALAHSRPGTKLWIVWADLSAVNVLSMETRVNCKDGIERLTSIWCFTQRHYTICYHMSDGKGERQGKNDPNQVSLHR